VYDAPEHADNRQHATHEISAIGKLAFLYSPAIATGSKLALNRAVT
jgi:hypothetical protein